MGAWLALTVVLVVVSRTAGSLTSDDLTLAGTGSTKSVDLLEQRLPNEANGTNPIVLEATQGKLTDSANSAAVTDAVETLRENPYVVRAVSPLDPEGKAALNKDETIGFISVTLNIGQADLDVDEADSVVNDADVAEKADIKVSAGGYLGQEVSKPSTHSSEIIGIGAAIIILLLAFGSAVAMIVPIITALLGVACTLSIIGLLGHAFEVPTVSPTLGTMIGLGVGIDYALFIVTRHKLQMKDGIEVQASVSRAVATAGGAVVFAGTTVIIALCSLAFAGIPIVANLGYAAAVAVLIAVSAAVTLLPALLSALGHRINSLRVQLGKTHPDDTSPTAGRAGRAGSPSAVAVDPGRRRSSSSRSRCRCSTCSSGQNDIGALSKTTTARQAYDGLERRLRRRPERADADLGRADEAGQANDQARSTSSNSSRTSRSSRPAATGAAGRAARRGGVPQDEAEQEVEQQTPTAQQRSRRSRRPAGEVPEVARQRSTATELRNAIKKDTGHRSRLAAEGEREGPRCGAHGGLDDRAVVTGHDRPRSTSCATPSSRRRLRARR